jgi:hypothetical protein
MLRNLAFVVGYAVILVLFDQLHSLDSEFLLS